MSTRPAGDPEPDAHRVLGLIANPFSTGKPSSEDSYPGVELIGHAAAEQLLVSIDSGAREVQSRPIWVEKAGDLPLSYYVTPLAEVLRVLGEEASSINVLAGYVPLDMMRLGRVRAVLSVIAERVAGVHVDMTIAAWIRRVLAEIDPDLPEHAAIASADLDGLAAALETDPTSTVERYFGACVAQRAGVEDLELLMRVSTRRQDALEIDPSAEAEASIDEEPHDELAEAFARPAAPSATLDGAAGTASESTEATTSGEPDDDLPRAEDLVAYVVSYTAAHLSPVLARALRAYRAQGYTSMTEELKVTKAPTKTLTALVRFATCRYRKVVILFDRFDVWESTPEDLRLKILGTLSQLRWALREGALLTLLAGTGQAPELEDLFAGGVRVVWDMPGLLELEGMDPPFVPELAQGWLDATTLAEHEPIRIDEEPLAGLVAASDGSLRQTAAILAAAIDDAASRGATHIDEAAATAAVSE